MIGVSQLELFPMLSPATLSSMFRSGDLPCRPRYVTQYWVVDQVKNDPLRCIGVYKHLRDHGGTRHAADTFEIMLEGARHRPFAFRWHWFNERRPQPARLPG